LLFGDVAAQKIQHKQHKHTSHDSDGSDEPFVLDTRRLAAFASFGAIYTGWFQMHWFRFLRFAFPAPSAAALAVSGRRLTFFRKDVLGPLLINQFGMVPCGYYPFYFGWTGVVRGATVQESLDAARAKYKPHLLAQNWAFWLPAQGVQFALVPAGYHILYVSAMGLAWNTILSLTTLDKHLDANADRDALEKPRRARGKMVVARGPK
jgi:protein Mpv17